jgi:Cu/Ag efflux protein CusF
MVAALATALWRIPTSGGTAAEAVSVWSRKSLVASAEAAQTYTTRGTIKTMASDRSRVNIHHDDIPGYMNAMTMSFHPTAPAQLDGLQVGDRVELTFTDEGGGKRPILKIRKL